MMLLLKAYHVEELFKKLLQQIFWKCSVFQIIDCQNNDDIAWNRISVTWKEKLTCTG